MRKFSPLPGCSGPSLWGLGSHDAHVTVSPRLLPLSPRNRAAKRPMTFEDMMQMKRLGDTAVSPDGKWLAYSVTTVISTQNTKTAELWVQAIAGWTEAGPIKLAVAQPGDSRHSVCAGRALRALSFCGREGGQQVWLADFDPATGAASNAKKLTAIATEADNAKWSPDGHVRGFHFGGLSGLPGDYSGGLRAGTSAMRISDAALAASKVKAQIFTHLLYRHWDHYTGDKRSHLFLVSVETGAMRDLNPGDHARRSAVFAGGRRLRLRLLARLEGAGVYRESPIRSRRSDQRADFYARSDQSGGEAGEDQHFGGRQLQSRLLARWKVSGVALARRGRGMRATSSGYGSTTEQRRRSKGSAAEPFTRLDTWVDEFAWAPDSKSIYFVSERARRST